MPNFGLFSNSFDKGSFNYPPDDINPKEKNDKWFLKYSQAFFSDYIRNQTGLPYGRRNDYKMARLYSESNQPTSKYMDIISPKDSNTGVRKGLMNISWDNVSVAPKFLNVVLGIFEKTDHDVICSAIDEMSINEKENKKWKMWVEKENKPLKEKLNQQVPGLNLKTESEIEPETIEELDMYMDMGGFKLKTEIAMEKALDYSFYISGWKKIKRKMFRDAFVIGVRGCKIYKEDNKFKARYVDPANVLVEYTETDDFSNINRIGEVTNWTIYDLKKAIPNMEISEIKRITNVYRDYENNAIYDGYFDYGQGGQDRYNVAVLDFEFYTVDMEIREYKKNKYGNEIIYDVDYEKKNKKDTENRKYKKVPIKKIMKCKWVIGTDVVFDYGQQEDVRYDDKEPKFNYVLNRMSKKSFIEMMIPAIDDIQIATLKLRNAVAVAPPPGIAIEIGSLENIVLGGNKLNPLEIFKIYTETGKFIYKATTTRGHMNIQAPAIKELPGGIGAILNETAQIYAMKIQEIRDVTGINQIADASIEDPRMLVGTGQMALASSNNALSGLYSGYVDIKEEVSRTFIKKIQISAKYDEEGYTVYSNPIGRASAEIIKIGSDISMVNFGIKVQMKPTQETKDRITNASLEALKKYETSGGISGGITLSDYAMIERALDGGSIKYAEAILVYKEKIRGREAQKNQQESQANIEKAKGETAMQEAQAYQMKKQADMQVEIAIETEKSKLRMQEREQKAIIDIREAVLIAEYNKGTTIEKALIMAKTAEKKMESDIEKERIKVSNKPKEEKKAA